ncbi:unnamed protein product [Durusdinium trenchii]|uniref:Uncharacterized protein n=1 Tax=Durusdinium trenchii TaxID=1381693 RepID=A0ABP0JIZ5_9DINO
MTMTHGTAIECHRHDESTISAQKAAKVSIKNARMLLYRGCTEFWTRRLATSCCRCNASLPYYAEDKLYRRNNRSLVLERLDPLPRNKLPDPNMTEEQRAMQRIVWNCMDNQDTAGVQKLCQEIPGDAGEEWQPVLRSIVHFFCKTLQYREAHMMFRRLPIRDTIAYNMMLQMLAKLRQTREFERYLQQMDEEEVPRSSITSCIILSACKESSDWQKALDILSELKTTSEGQHSTNVPYLLAMTACARAREKDTVAKLLEEMKANPSAEVTRSHYNAMLVACGTDVEGVVWLQLNLFTSHFTPSLRQMKFFPSFCGVWRRRRVKRPNLE